MTECLLQHTPKKWTCNGTIPYEEEGSPYCQECCDQYRAPGGWRAIEEALNSEAERLAQKEKT